MSDFTIVKLLDKLNPTIITGGFVPRGAYDNATDYAVGDSVDYLGSSYVMWSNAAAGTLPTDTDYWQVVANGGVSSVNTKSGIVVLDPDDLDDTATTNKFTTAGDISKLAGIEALADVTDTTNVTAAGAVMDSELTSLSGVKTLTVPDNTTISTFGATITDDTDAAAARTTLGLTAGGAGDIWVEKAGDTMTGNLVFSGSQKIIGGTSTTADLTLQTTTGVGATGADMHFLVGNNGATEAMTILNDGNVGIGTTAPSASLNVVRTVNTQVARFANNLGAAALSFSIERQNGSGVATGATRFGFISNNSDIASLAGFNFYTGNTADLNTTANGTNAMSITTAGNVGIGTTASTALLEALSQNAAGIRITSNVSTSGGSRDAQLFFRNATTDRASIGYDVSGNALIFSVNGLGVINQGDASIGAAMTLTSAGNVGIGTTAPSTLLEVSQATDGAVVRVTSAQNNSSHSTTTPYASFQIYKADASGTAGIASAWRAYPTDTNGNAANVSLSVNVGASGDQEVLFLNSSGNAGIGLASSTNKFQVYESTYGNLIQFLPTSMAGYGMDAGGAGFIITGGTDATGQDAGFVLRNEQSNNKWVIGIDSSDSDKLHFSSPNFNSNNILTMLLTGSIGIGTSNPLCTLHIIGPNNASGGLRMQDNLTDATNKVARIKVGHYTNAEEPVTAMLIFSTAVSNEINYGGGTGAENSATTLNFYTGATTTTTTGTIRMQVNSFGNVGIGTTGQLARLHVFGTADDEQLIVQAHSTQTAPLFQLWNSSAAVLVSFSGLGGAIFNEQGADADFRVEGDTDADLLFADASTDRVGIGLNTPGYKLDVNGDINLPAGSAYRVGGTAGVSGTFTTVDLKTVTVTKGIITSIV